ncbi:MAG TPA: DEAD/DEAH box helicase [Alphaproteobacteria bacterium]|nr:DEAD/DEAH box helicase [Alphaproteobacteria bacterium]
MTLDFSGFGLPPRLLQSLARMRFQQPTPIQAKAIPFALEGRDILGSAQTGTGKTGAFGIPLIAKLMEHPGASALVMTPTRELAAQVMAAMQQLIPVPDIKTALLIGGEPMPRQLRQLQARPRLMVGTPGRINDHLQRGSVKLGNTRFLVLDETDRMLDMGFGVQIDRILAYMPKERQTMLFSATLPQGIVRLTGKYLKNPERVSVGSTIAAAPNIRQELVQTSDAEKGAHLLKALVDAKGSVIIFVKTKYGTEKLADRLVKKNYRAEAIHGDLRQSRRDRVIQGFRDKKFQVLVATDVAARGLDVPHIETVINYDLPQCPEDYIHRIGRTARVGASGKAISFVTPNDNAKWRAIYRLMNPGDARPEKTFNGDGHKQGWNAKRRRSGRPYAHGREDRNAGRRMA